MEGNGRNLLAWGGLEGTRSGAKGKTYEGGLQTNGVSDIEVVSSIPSFTQS